MPSQNCRDPDRRFIAHEPPDHAPQRLQSRATVVRNDLFENFQRRTAQPGNETGGVCEVTSDTVSPGYARHVRNVGRFGTGDLEITLSKCPDVGRA